MKPEWLRLEGSESNDADPNAQGPGTGESARRLENFLLSSNRTVHDALECLDRNASGIVLITDETNRLLDTVTDGDIRRFVLAKHVLDAPLSRLLEHKHGNRSSPHVKPVFARVGTDPAVVLGMMRDHGVHQVPLLDEADRVVDLRTMDDLVPEPLLPVHAVIMAGGFGKRLASLTTKMPKPMLPVGDRPLMERILGQLQQAGIRRVNVTTHFMPEKIIDHFGDGARFGLEMNYINEECPLGTAGAISLLEESDEPFLVMNGDILTGVDFRALHAYHKENAAAMTVGIRKYEIKVPYGVVEHQGYRVDRIDEKPCLEFFVSAGIYLIEPSVRTYIPSGQRYDMPDLIRSLVADGRTVVSYPILEYWLDIGKPNDYEQALDDVRRGRIAA